MKLTTTSHRVRLRSKCQLYFYNLLTFIAIHDGDIFIFLQSSVIIIIVLSSFIQKMYNDEQFWNYRVNSSFSMLFNFVFPHPVQFFHSLLLFLSRYN